MANAKGIRAGKAYVELGANDSKLKAGLAAAQRRLKSFGASISSLGRGIALTGAAIVGPLAFATKTFANFDQQMAKVAAITGSTGDSLASLRAEAKRLGATTQFSASQAAEAMTFLGMAGFNTEQILAGIGPTLKLAAAGGLELGMAADIASDVSSAFGLTADEIGRVADVMAVTATSANTNIEMMGETFKYVAPLAAAAGQSIEETSAAIGVIANSGIKASMAGTDLALIMKGFGDSAVVNKLNKIGVATADASGKVRNISDVMADLSKATANMTQQEKLAFMASTFGRAAKSAIILSNSGEGFDQLKNKIDNSSGAAERMADVMQNNLGGVWTRLMSGLEGVQIAIIEHLKKPLTVAGDVISMVMGVVTQFVSENKRMIQIIAAAGVALVGIGTTLLLVGFSFTAASIAVGGLITAISLAGSILSGLSAIVATVISPIGILIGLVGGLTVAFFQWTSVGQAVVNWFGTEFGKLLTVVTSTVGGMFNAIKGGNLALAAEIAFTGVKLAIATVMESVLSLFGSSIESMMAMLAGLWKKISQVLSRLNIARQQAVNFISSSLSDLVGDSAEDQRGRQLEEQRRRLLESQGRDYQADDTSRDANLNGMQESDLNAALDSADAADNMDTDAMAKAWASALDTDELKKKLDELNATASEQATAAATDDLNVADLKFDFDAAAATAGQTADTSFGTFNARAATQFGAVNLQKKMAKGIDKIAKNTDPKNQQGLLATS